MLGGRTRICNRLAVLGGICGVLAGGEGGMERGRGGKARLRPSGAKRTLLHTAV